MNIACPDLFQSCFMTPNTVLSFSLWRSCMCYIGFMFSYFTFLIPQSTVVLISFSNYFLFFPAWLRDSWQIKMVYISGVQHDIWMYIYTVKWLPQIKQINIAVTSHNYHFLMMRTLKIDPVTSLLETLQWLPILLIKKDQSRNFLPLYPGPLGWSSPCFLLFLKHTKNTPASGLRVSCSLYLEYSSSG